MDADKKISTIHKDFEEIRRQFLCKKSSSTFMYDRRCIDSSLI